MIYLHTVTEIYTHQNCNESKDLWQYWDYKDVNFSMINTSKFLVCQWSGLLLKSTFTLSCRCYNDKKCSKRFFGPNIFTRNMQTVHNHKVICFRKKSLWSHFWTVRILVFCAVCLFERLCCVTINYYLISSLYIMIQGSFINLLTYFYAFWPPPPLCGNFGCIHKPCGQGRGRGFTKCPFYNISHIK